MDTSSLVYYYILSVRVWHTVLCRRIYLTEANLNYVSMNEELCNTLYLAVMRGETPSSKSRLLLQLTPRAIEPQVHATLVHFSVYHL